LRPCPVWTRLDGALPSGSGLRRRLDLHTGLLRQDVDGLQVSSFASLARPGTVALRAQGAAKLLRSEEPLVPAEEHAESARAGGAVWVREGRAKAAWPPRRPTGLAQTGSSVSPPTSPIPSAHRSRRTYSRRCRRSSEPASNG